MKHPITQTGIDIIKERIASLRNEYDEIIEEMQIAQSSQSSNEDNPDGLILLEKSKSVMASIGKYNAILKDANIIDVSNVQSDKVVFGSTVVIENVDTGEQHTYQILSEYESNPSKGSVSYTSPMGKEMIGLYEGDEFYVTMGHKGDVTFEIIEVK